VTYSGCWITLEGIDDYRDERNPAPFRRYLPPTLKGAHYWVPVITEFAEARGIEIRWVWDNLTPEIILSAVQLEEFLLPIYGIESEFFRQIVSVLNPHSRYVVYGTEF
jgi:hypothetical protein